MNALPLTMLFALGAIDELGPGFYHDFRNKRFSDRTFQLNGQEATSRITPEPEGLHLTLPAEYHLPGDLWIRPQVKVIGDFELTIGYEILRMDQPKAGTRIGYFIVLRTDTPTKETISFFRMRLGDGRDVYRSGRKTVNKEGKSVTPTSEYIPTGGGKAGQLRLARRGSIVVLTAAEQSDIEFREIVQWDLGTEDIVDISTGIHPLNSGGGTGVDVRLLDLRVRGKVVSTVRGSLVSPDNAQDVRGTWLWLLAGLFVLAFVVFGGLWTWRKRRQDRIEGQ